MPELPEVEVVRRGVHQWATGRTVRSVTVHDDRSLRRHPAGPDAFRRHLTGLRLGEPQRRGKFLWIPLLTPRAHEPSSALVIHLGMSGQVLMERDDAPAEKHLKITLDLGTGHGVQNTAAQSSTPNQLRFVDQRIFGGMHIAALVPDVTVAGSSRLIPQSATHIAPDPLEPAVTAEWFFQALRRRRTGLKRALLDQTVLSGVGNIYADEALWRAQLHYARRTDTITRAAAARLLTGLREVMEAALEAGGTSFDALYVNVNGASGYFDRSLEAYGQAGRECSRCAAVAVEGSSGPPTVIMRAKFMGRSSYWCPSCQPRPRNGHW
ncbi:bifunctional DNA-formamidopyrimidine glycosylase/DNA-(apurinic or apyrimidinic site) lyase [Nesterenkonia sphaerica]|uniref:Bifunctional DNA-formamidopyrimidine glycosylase/DNA-(Apurinic or apyrimidinic site) lyase n=1 Tax=Nesterenkonia sphaerica TaxID=1804988 RepID=A0A5R9AML3_9MICC|nr:bifunctional DNA-formamidopyrimidine glycosylase/DNA-(apurinic or apyrimidinic site) lyase [Nesterenkonia sphaerica]TLP79852.1 bifunctional DNA-formamidopyrimidine glycosylase/DNA-(apurinic or apyrimidinic site) lyase [Nesterenkonia sphaerica]